MKKILNFLGAASLLVGTVGSITAFSSNHALQSTTITNLKSGGKSVFEDWDSHSNQEGDCYLSASDLKDYLADSGSLTSNHFWNWISGWSSDGWAQGRTFRDFFSQGNLDSLQELVNGTNSHIYYGKFWSEHWNTFNYAHTLSYIRFNARLGKGIIVGFLGWYAGPFSHNRYGSFVKPQPS